MRLRLLSSGIRWRRSTAECGSGSAHEPVLHRLHRSPLRFFETMWARLGTKSREMDKELLTATVCQQRPTKGESTRPLAPRTPTTRVRNHCSEPAQSNEGAPSNEGSWSLRYELKKHLALVVACSRKHRQNKTCANGPFVRAFRPQA